MARSVYVHSIVDSMDCYRARLSFLTGEYFGFARLPWIEISADVYLSRKFQHYFTLSLSEGNSRFNIRHEFRLPGRAHTNAYLWQPQLEAKRSAEDSEFSSAATWSDTQSLSSHSIQDWEFGESLTEYAISNMPEETHGISEDQSLEAIPCQRKTGTVELPRAKRRFISRRRSW